MTTLSSIYQEIKLAYLQKNWSRIRVLSQKDIVRNPTRPNLEILPIILKSLAKSSAKPKKLPPGYIKPSTFTFQHQTTDVLLLMAKNMKIENVLSLCETSKAFNKGICKNDIFWIQRLERDFGSIERKGERSYYQEYVIKYKLRRQKILSEYKEYPGLELQINKWLKDTSKILNISSLGFNLREWPEVLKGKEYLIVKLWCSDNQFTTLPALPNCVELDCYENQLISLPELPNCVELWCSYNQLTSLPVLANCVGLNCNNNRLTSLPVLAKCVHLYCDNNQLATLSRSGSTSLPTLLKCVGLDCRYNQLTSLPALPSIQSRYDLNASNNPFPPGYTHRLL